jgi:hypothetical protein
VKTFGIRTVYSQRSNTVSSGTALILLRHCQPQKYGKESESRSIYYEVSVINKFMSLLLLLCAGIVKVFQLSSLARGAAVEAFY